MRLSDGREILIPKTTPVLNSWDGKELSDTYGGKAVLEYEGGPLFAELVILKTLFHDGWSGVWVDNYRRKFWTGMPGTEAPVMLPTDKLAVLDSIRGKNRSMSGCWDVFAWKEGKVLFAESKRDGKDHIRTSQIKWLESALAIGLSSANFLLVEWSLRLTH